MRDRLMATEKRSNNKSKQSKTIKESAKTTDDKAHSAWLTPARATLIAAVITAIAAIVAATISRNGNQLASTVNAPTVQVAVTQTDQSPTTEPTSSPLPTYTQVPTPTSSPTPEATHPPRALAEGGVASNSEWMPNTAIVTASKNAEMALVPIGCFQMGSTIHEADEEPVHEVCFEKPYWIDVYEVTNLQYGGVASGKDVGGNDCATVSGGDDNPHNCISWIDADAYCRSRNARLPTEAEWEYAARGPDSLLYPWGNEFARNNLIYAGNSRNQTWVVGSIPASASWVGAYDLVGNLWEWVNDRYSNEYYASVSSGVVNPQGPLAGDFRVIKGGSITIGDEHKLTSANRHGYPPTLVVADVGFRCALDYMPETR